MIKEPYVSLKEVIIDNPGVANIDESSILAGVINAPCGPDHLLVNGPKQFLKEFTVGNAIPRNADVTLINAYFCSFFAPLLVKRAWCTEAGKVPIQCHDFSAMSSTKVDVDSLPNQAISASNYLSLKYPTDYKGTITVEEITVMAPKWVVTKAYATGNKVYYNGNYYVATTAITADSTDPSINSNWKLILEFSSTKSYSTDDLVTHNGSIFSAKHSIAAGAWNITDWNNQNNPNQIPIDPTQFIQGATQWVVGITNPSTWDDPNRIKSTKIYKDFGALPYNFTDEELEGNNLYVVYWYDAALGEGATLDESAGYRLVSTSMTGINPRTEREVYFKDVLDSDEVPFNIEELAFVAGEFIEAKFGFGGTTSDYNDPSTGTPDYKTAFGWFKDNSDVYNISYVSAFGHTESGYESMIASDCRLESTRWYYFCDVPINVSTTVSSVKEWANIGDDNYRFSIHGGWDKNPSVTGWLAPIAPSSLIYQKLYSNKNSNSEFAPLFDATNGTLGYVKPYKQFTKSQREELLNATYPINWVKYDRTNNVYYMNDNRTHTRKINVMDEEMNVRMVNKIQRDVMLLVQRYKSMLNNVETRLDVVRVITDYMDRYIMNQNYRPIEYRIVCDDTNNTPDIINANKLAIELDVRIQGSIKFIEVLNKVFPVGVAFEQ